MPPPVIPNVIATGSQGWWSVTHHFLGGGKRWKEKWYAALDPATKDPISDLQAMSVQLASWRTSFLDQNSSLNGVTYAYIGPGGFKQKAYTSASTADGVMNGGAQAFISTTAAPVELSLGVRFYDPSSSVWQQREFRGLTNATVKNITTSNPITANVPELAGIIGMTNLLALPKQVVPSGGAARWMMRSSAFVPGTSGATVQVAAEVYLEGGIVYTTVGGQIPNPANPSGFVQQGDIIKVSGLKSSCFKGINGSRKVISVQANTGFTWSYYTNAVVCCNPNAMLNWTGWAWAAGQQAWPFGAWGVPFITGIAKRDTGVTGLGATRGKRRSKCCRPQPLNL
jgi:hypothetical protein